MIQHLGKELRILVRQDKTPGEAKITVLAPLRKTALEPLYSTGRQREAQTVGEEEGSNLFVQAKQILSQNQDWPPDLLQRWNSPPKTLPEVAFDSVQPRTTSGSM